MEPLAQKRYQTALEKVQNRCLSLCKREMVPLESLEKCRKIADMVETYAIFDEEVQELIRWTSSRGLLEV